MRKIAVLASGEARSAERLITLFNEGNRIRVVAVVTDGDPAVLEARFRDFGVTVMGVTPESDPDSLVDLERRMEECGAEYYAIDGYEGLLADRLHSRHGERVVVLTSPEEAPREVVAAFETAVNSTPGAESVSDPDRPKTPDEEWAETLHITPPPVPEKQSSPEDTQQQYGSSQPENQQPPVHPNFAANPQYGVGYGSPNNPGMGPKREPIGHGNGYQYGNRPVNSEPMPSNYLILSVIMTVLCCTIPGIVAIFYSAKVSTKYYVGDMEGARRCSHNAQIWIIVSFVLGVLSATLYLPISLIS